MALDQKALDELRSLDPDGSAGVLQQIIASYLNDTQGILARIHASFAARDLAAMTREAHSLKSTSLSVGASAVGKAAAALELAGKSGAGEACGGLIDTLTAEFADAQIHLRALLTPQ